MTGEQMQFYEGLYRIKLTEREREMLDPTFHQGWRSRADALDKQRSYLLEVALTPCDCPGCHGKICQRSTRPAEHDETKHTPDDLYVCNICGAKLTLHMGMYGEQWFTLNPGQTVTVPAVR